MFTWQGLGCLKKFSTSLPATGSLLSETVGPGVTELSSLSSSAKDEYRGSN